jgi:hypothetical protein
MKPPAYVVSLILLLATAGASAGGPADRAIPRRLIASDVATRELTPESSLRDAKNLNLGISTAVKLGRSYVGFVSLERGWYQLVTPNKRWAGRVVTVSREGGHLVVRGPRGGTTRLTFDAYRHHPR